MGRMALHSSPYHPRTNGRVEYLNGIIDGILTKLLLGLRRFADLLDFEKTTSEEITRQSTANSEQVLRNADSSRGQGNDSGSGGSGGSSSGSHRNTGTKSAEHSVGSSSQRSFKAKRPATKLSSVVTWAR
jgi:hypothetical protein